MISIGTYSDVAGLLCLSKQTIYGYTSSRVFPQNVYLGRGRFNLNAIEEHIQNNTLFPKKQEAISLRPSGKVDYKKRIQELQEEMAA